jgi:hypothetical protein
MLGFAPGAALGILLALPVAGAAPVGVIPPTGSDDSCPSARQVTDALQAHLPGQVISDKGLGTPRTDLLRAQLDVPADGTVVRFSLTDAQGVVQLRRALPAPGRGRPVADCVALAETLAVIVERYFSSVPLETEETELPPPPEPEPVVAVPPVVAAPRPPPAPGPSIFVGSAWRATPERTTAFEFGLGATVNLTGGNVRLAGLLRLGIEQSQGGDFDSGVASLRRFAARAGLLVAIPAGPGTLEPTLELGADTYLGSATTATHETQSLRPTPVAELQVGYRVALGSHLYLRPRAGGGFAIVRYQVVAVGPNDAQSDIFKTPAWFSTLGLDVGLVFR